MDQHQHEIFEEMPLAGKLGEIGELVEKPPLEDYIDREAVVALTNLFDELAKKYEGMTTTSDNGLDFAEELKKRMEQIFEGRSNQVCDSVKLSFGKMGEIAEADLGFTYDKERSDGNFMSEDELKVLEWFDVQKQKELLTDLISWQHEVMRMTQWLGMLEGGEALVAQFSERWREFAGKRLGAESAEARLRGIAGPLLFAKLCDEADYEAFLPEVAWDQDDEVDLLVRSKANENLVFAVQLKAKRGGKMGMYLDNKTPNEKDHLTRAANRLDQSWSRSHGIRVEPLYVFMEGLGDNQVGLDLINTDILNTDMKNQIIENIKETLGQIGSDRMGLPLAA